MNRIDWWHVLGFVVMGISAGIVAFGLWLAMAYVMTAFPAR